MFVVSVRERGKEEHKFTFRKPEIVVGRLRASDIILPKRNISKRHAVFALTDGKVVLQDMGSTNGSYINGKKVLENTVVGPDDKIFMGDYILQVEVLDDRTGIAAQPAGQAAKPSSSPAQSFAKPDEDRRPTAVHLEDDMLQMDLPDYAAQSSGAGGPATVVVDPLSVPTAPPPPEVLGEADVHESSREISSDFELEEEAAADTLRFRQAARAPADPHPSEELLDIPLLDEEGAPEPATSEARAIPEQHEIPQDLLDVPLDEQPLDDFVEPAPRATQRRVTAVDLPPAPTPPPAQAPARTPGQAPAGLGAFTPSASRVDLKTSALLERHYVRLAAQFDAWAASSNGTPNRRHALDRLTGMLGGILGEGASGSELSGLAELMLSELLGFGPVAGLLQDPKVGEVFVAASGSVLAYDWRGTHVPTQVSFSCPAAVARVAAKVSPSAGLGLQRLDDGTLLKVLASPLSGENPCLRFVRPYQTSMSLGKLTETGLAGKEAVARLRQAVEAGRSILVVGRIPALNSLVLHGLAATLSPEKKLLVCGDRFGPAEHLKNLSTFSPTALDSDGFLSACAALEVHGMVLDAGSLQSLVRGIRICQKLQIPLLAATRVAMPSRLPAALAGVDDRPDDLFRLLDAVGMLVVATPSAEDGTSRVDGIHMFTLDSGRPKLVPFA